MSVSTVSSPKVVRRPTSSPLRPASTTMVCTPPGEAEQAQQYAMSCLLRNSQIYVHLWLTLGPAVRSNTLAAAERLWARIKKCFDAGALATGCTVEYEHINSYADVRSSRVICREFCDVMPSGSVAWDQPADFIAGSTDQGNVTYECPAFHGGYGINTAKGKGNHTAEFTEAAALESSLDQTLDWAKGMAAVAWRVLSDDAFAEEVKKDWEEDMERAKA